MISISFVICFLFLWWKSSYGYIFNDEPYILTLGDRLVKGDLLLIDEWRPAQMTGYLLYPFIRIYNFFNPSTKGFILVFRHLYVILWSSAVLFCYFRFKKFAAHRWVAAAAALYLWLFASLDQMTLSYNFFSLSGILICSALWMTSDKSISYFFIGIFYSIAVLACPYLAFLYFAYVVVYLLSLLKLSMPGKHSVDNCHTRRFLLISTGILISVFLFAAFFFLRGGSIPAAVKSFPYILSDNEYPAQSLGSRICGYIGVFCVDYRMFIIPSTLLITASLIDRKHQFQYFAAHAIWLLFALLILFLYYHLKLNYIMVPISLLGFQAMLSDKNPNHKLQMLFWFGILYSIVLFFSSNLRAMAVAMGLSISGFVSFLLIDSYLCSISPVQDCHHQNRKNIYMLMFICASQIIVESGRRYVFYYMDNSIWKLNTEITEGPAAGIFTTASRAQEYDEIFHDIQLIPSGSKVLLLSMEPWIYLCNDMKYATYSSWISGNADYYLKRLSSYYSIHPEKLPDYIYILQRDYDPAIDNNQLFQGLYNRTNIGISIIYSKK